MSGPEKVSLAVGGGILAWALVIALPAVLQACARFVWGAL